MSALDVSGSGSSVPAITPAETLFEDEVFNPNGSHLEGGWPVAGNTWQIWVDEEEGERVVMLGDETMTPETAKELARTLLEAVEVAEPSRLMCPTMTVTEAEQIATNLGISMADLMKAMAIRPTEVTS